LLISKLTQGSGEYKGFINTVTANLFSAAQAHIADNIASILNYWIANNNFHKVHATAKNFFIIKRYPRIPGTL
jgi:hypothetical protein